MRQNEVVVSVTEYGCCREFQLDEYLTITKTRKLLFGNPITGSLMLRVLRHVGTECLRPRFAFSF